MSSPALRIVAATAAGLAVLLTATLGQSETETPGVVFGVDERVPSSIDGVARTADVRCTAWLASNGAALTAGHCIKNSEGEKCPVDGRDYRLNVIEFDVPLSTSSGGRNPPADPGRSVYDVVPDPILCEYSSGGNSLSKDWAVFAVLPNADGQSAFLTRGFFRVADLQFASQAEQAQTVARLRVTGYGSDCRTPNLKGNCNGEIRTKYNSTQQTATGPLKQIIAQSGYDNARYVVDTMPGNSGGPVTLAGTRVAIAIHTGGRRSWGYNRGTWFGLKSLQEALHKLPGLISNPPVPEDQIFYVDNGGSDFIHESAGDGFVMTPFSHISDGLAAAAQRSGTSLVSVVTGKYGGILNHKEASLEDLTINLTGDILFKMPVGDVTLWDGEAPAH